MGFFRSRPRSEEPSSAPSTVPTRTIATTTTTSMTNYQSLESNEDYYDRIQDCSHRGFSTSIGDMFASPEHERVDCCALTCGGVLQSDRDRFLLQGIKPPGVCRRFWLHLVLPFLIFFMAAYGVSNIPNAITKQIMAYLCLLLLVTYLCLQCYKGRMKRLDIRKDLLWTKYQIINNRRESIALILEHERPEEDRYEFLLGQTSRDLRSAHPCCLIGCYPEDRMLNQDYGRDNNICGNMWYICCGPTCGMHLQLCGVCAVAQEGREIDSTLLPPAYRRIDYLTMQSYASYYPDIYKAKLLSQSENGTEWKFPALSRLSIRILQSLAALVLSLLFWSFVDSTFWRNIVKRNIPHHKFHYVDFIVFCATWLQALFLLAILAYLTNKPKQSGLSMDAIIKYFASGFCLSTSLAAFWEVVFGLTVKVVVSLMLAIAGVDVVDDPNSNANWMKFGTSLAPLLRSADEADFVEVFGRSHPILYTIYLAVASFLLAAFIEELCKYFGFRLVEHPDFLSKREIEETVTLVMADNDEELEQGRRRRSEGYDFSMQQTSCQAKGSATTLAMICVAMGFTCCENIVYVFFYAGDSPASELEILLIRSLFPVHPICAAIQSIGVVRRDVEGDASFKLGRIILPAVLFHGGYDFFLMWIDFLVKRRGVYANGDDNNAYDSSIVGEMASFLVSAIFMAVALFYYFREGRKQRNRLIEMDRQRSLNESNVT